MGDGLVYVVFCAKCVEIVGSGEGKCRRGRESCVCAYASAEVAERETKRNISLDV